MRDHDRSTDNIGDGKNLEDLLAGDAKLVAFAEMVFHAIVATQHHGSHKAEHLFRLRRKRAVLVRIRIEIEEPFEHEVIRIENAFVHFRAVIVEVVDEWIHSSEFKFKVKDRDLKQT